MDLNERNAERLVDFIQGLDAFPKTLEGGPSAVYDHMGATLTDAVLQAGMNYRHTVQPRVQAVLQQYPEARSTTAFHAVVQAKGAAQVLEWQEGAKPQRLRDLLSLFLAEGIETEAALRIWLNQEGNPARLQAIKGVKTKTFQYLRILCGEPEAVAVDVRLRAFFKRADIAVAGDEALADTVTRAAARLGVTPAALDHAIWAWVDAGPPPVPS